MPVMNLYHVATLLGSLAGTLAAGFTNITAGPSQQSLLADGHVELGNLQESYSRAVAFVDQLSFAQKIQVITGQSIDDNGTTWSALSASDGVNGVDNTYFASAFTSPTALGMTWNRDLVYAQYQAQGEEFYDKGIQVVYGPVQGPLGRVPWSGRIVETFSPEPYLSGVLEGLTTSGYNAAGVIAAGRHFLLNEQETNRFGGGYSSNANDKIINELYAWPFADSIRSGMMACMCAMNKVNGTMSCENSPLLNGLLKSNIGFTGMVMPDVSAQSTALGSANGGLDYGSGQLWTESTLGAAITAGNFSMDRLDDMVTRQVLAYYAAGLDQGSQPSQTDAIYRDVRRNHSSIIQKVGREAIVLLKNENLDGRGLPLNKPRSIGLFGAHAGPVMAGPNQPATVGGAPAEVYPGHLAGPTGSGVGAYVYLVDPHAAISARAVADDSMLVWIMNDTYTSPYEQGIGGPSTGYVLSTFTFEKYASFPEACLVFINAWSGEGADRSSLTDADQDAMVETVAGSCNNTIVVANVAGPRLLEAWVDHVNVTAVLYSGLLGQDSGNAIADVLYGDVNPSGKLTYTIAKNESDYPAAVESASASDFSEGVFIDYRYFDANNISVRYPFGHGLSYTTFQYGDFSTRITNATALQSTHPTGPLAMGGRSDLFDEVATVTGSITNTGNLTGSEVAQLYLGFPEEAEQPIRILRGFAKAEVPPGRSADFTFSLRRRDLSYWDTVAQEWAIAKGEYTVFIGASSRDIRSTTTLIVE